MRRRKKKHLRTFLQHFIRPMIRTQWMNEMHLAEYINQHERSVHTEQQKPIRPSGDETRDREVYQRADEGGKKKGETSGRHVARPYAHAEVIVASSGDAPGEAQSEEGVEHRPAETRRETHPWKTLASYRHV